MPEHTRYEELCALALVGQISAEDSAELEAHLKECASCRNVQADFVEIESVWLSKDDDSETSSEEGSTLNHRILRRMQSAGAKFSKETMRQAAGRKRFFFPALRSMTVPAYATAALVLVAAGGAIGFGMAVHRSPQTPEKIVVTVPAQPLVPQPDQALQRLAAEDVDLKTQLAAADKQLAERQAQLADAQRRLSGLQTTSSADAAQIAQLQAVATQARNDAATAQAQLAQLRAAQDSKDADLVAAQYRAQAAETKLAETSASLDRERQLLGTDRDIRDIVGARNLHIVDVADVGNSGVKKPFGRIFYTEGKSLVVYAYDLANTKGHQSFTVWGVRDGDPHSARVLGILMNDDKAQKRWALRFDDPKLLAEINSVFVTLEPNDKPGSAPKGKKLLNAYLGTPANHP